MKPKNILIFNPFGIGDVLFTTPLVKNLKESLRANITYICNRRVYPLLKNSPYLDKVLVFEKDEWRKLGRESKREFIKRFFSFRREIRQGKFDSVFDLSLNSQYGFFFKMAGIRKRIGLNFKKRGRFLTHKIDIPQGYTAKHVVRYYLDLLKFLNIASQEYLFGLSVPAEVLRRAAAILSARGINKAAFLVGVSPGSGDSWGNTAYFRRWPEDYFVELCSRLQKELGAEIILFGSDSERQLCGYIAGRLKPKPLNLCGRVTLEEFCALVSLCRLIITNDGGPFHIAQALGKEILVFFGPQNEQAYGAYPDENHCLLLAKNLPCRPCYAGFKFKGCNFDKECLRRISPAEAFSVIAKKFGKLNF